MRIEQATSRLHFVTTEHVNWVIYDGEDGILLIDSGYLGQWDLLRESLRQLGKEPADVAAVLITHAHADHIGGASRLAAEQGTPVYARAEEVPHLRRERIEQVGPVDVLRNALRPGVLPWALAILPLIEGQPKLAVPSAQRVPRLADGAIDLPGRPEAIAASGHTSGNTMFHFPDEGAVVVGDASSPGTGRPAGRARSCSSRCSTRTSARPVHPCEAWSRSMRSSSCPATGRPGGARRPMPSRAPWRGDQGSTRFAPPASGRQPFTAPAMTPATSCRPAMARTSSRGAATRKTPAITRPVSEVNAPRSWGTTSGIVSCDLITTDGQKKLFHEPMNVNSASVAAAGRAAGRPIDQNVRNSDAPSTRAASMSSYGSASLRYCVIQNTPNAP